MLIFSILALAFFKDTMTMAGIEFAKYSNQNDS
jgi:hypothetical protein